MSRCKEGVLLLFWNLLKSAHTHSHGHFCILLQTGSLYIGFILLWNLVKVPCLSLILSCSFWSCLTTPEMTPQSDIAVESTSDIIAYHICQRQNILAKRKYIHGNIMFSTSKQIQPLRPCFLGQRFGVFCASFLWVWVKDCLCQ